MKLDSQITGNVGLYYCCYHLSLLGWNVMPPARNARGIDIVAYDRSATRFIYVQVKALSKRNLIPLETTLDKVMGAFWVIVNKVARSPCAFMLLPSEIKERAHHGEIDGRVSFRLQPTEYDHEAFGKRGTEWAMGNLCNMTLQLPAEAGGWLSLSVSVLCLNYSKGKPTEVRLAHRTHPAHCRCKRCGR
jgi:hypothetical protein